MSDRFFDDFEVGDTFVTRTFTLSEQESVAFARVYDPQPFHLDAAAAETSIFRRLVASGWHTAAITMRLIVECGILEATGIIGTGIDELRWHSAVYPGDTLRVRGEVLEKLPSPNDGRRGILRVRLQTVNQNDAVVMSQIANLMMPLRPIAGK